jgi:predicted nucleic acid-binding protein
VPIKQALIDAGPLIAYYDAGDEWHATAKKFMENYRGQLITSEPIITEVMWNLKADYRVQNEFLTDLLKETFTVEPLVLTDFKYLSDLNEKYSDLPGDFAYLSIVALSTRLKILDVASIDGDFDLYRSLGKTFKHVFPKWEKP